VIATSGGAVDLNDPAQKTHRMLFGGLGADLSLGLRIPRMPSPKVRGNAPAGAGSVTDFPSGGRIMRSDKLGRELQRGDFRGAVLFVEGGGGLVAGMNVGVQPGGGVAGLVGYMF
jgi:hypothetical protein